MKNKFYLFLILLIMPFCVSATQASDHCNVIKGTGNDIGDEIECAGEHFYIIDKANNKTKMLAKYNLYAGDMIVNIFPTIERYEELENLYKITGYSDLNKEVMNEPEFAPYKALFETLPSYHVMSKGYPNHFEVYGDIPDINVNDDKSLVKQDESAIGAHGDAIGDPDPLQIGVFGYITPPRDAVNEYEDYFGDFGPEMKDMLNMDLYEQYLSDRNIHIDDIDVMSVKELRDVIFKVSGRQLPLKEWFRNQQQATSRFYSSLSVYVLGDLKEYLPAGYEWLYSTTYWTKTGTSSTGYEWFRNNRNEYLTSYVYFVDTLGFLCNKYGCETAIGAGSRPVVTIDDSILRYAIYTKVSGSGSIEVVSSAIPGELINFTIKANKDLELKRLTIVTPSGERISFSENDITYNEDGTITIRSNSFIMPKESVTIEAEWSDYVKGVEENPKTGYSSYISIIVLSLMTFIFVYVSVNKKHCFKQYN